jgi:hypothetical protein
LLIDDHLVWLGRHGHCPASHHSFCSACDTDSVSISHLPRCIVFQSLSSTCTDTIVKPRNLIACSLTHARCMALTHAVPRRITPHPDKAMIPLSIGAINPYPNRHLHDVHVAYLAMCTCVHAARRTQSCSANATRRMHSNAVTGDRVPPRVHLYLCALPLDIACSLTVLDHGSVNLWFLRGSDNVWKLWAPASSSRGTGRCSTKGSIQRLREISRY